MKRQFVKSWINGNNGAELNSAEVDRLISVMPSASQYRLSRNPFYCFIHFGMNTATDREWGAGVESVEDFDIEKIDTDQWAMSIKASGATGIILTCKHHDGFCLWHTKYSTFSVEYSPYKKDIVKAMSNSCLKYGLKFGIYLSPWDMHEKSYGSEEYNEYFCNQLIELLTHYGDIFEVWFDGAKGAGAKKFQYDWQKYYDIVRKLQPFANIAICGPDIRWVGNEGGQSRYNEYSVVPTVLRDVEGVEKESQTDGKDTAKLKHLTSKSVDLGSRKVLKNYNDLCWYPAEVDVSIRKGWFWHKNTNRTVKSANKLFKIYLNSVGNNCSLLLNVPPNKKGVISKKEVRALKKLGMKINNMTSRPIIVENFGKLSDEDGYLEFNFGDVKQLQYIILKEDIRFSQRVEKFDIYVKKENESYKKIYSAGVIGSSKIIKTPKIKCIGAVFIIRQSRSTPYIAEVGFYE